MLHSCTYSAEMNLHLTPSPLARRMRFPQLFTLLFFWRTMPFLDNETDHECKGRNKQWKKCHTKRKREDWTAEGHGKKVKNGVREKKNFRKNFLRTQENEDWKLNVIFSECTFPMRIRSNFGELNQSSTTIKKPFLWLLSCIFGLGKCMGIWVTFLSRDWPNGGSFQCRHDWLNFIPQCELILDIPPTKQAFSVFQSFWKTVSFLPQCLWVDIRSCHTSLDQCCKTCHCAF